MLLTERDGLGIIAGFICLLAAMPSGAAAAPAQLLNKTVRVSFTVSTNAKTPTGRIVPASRNSAFVLYISSAGRVFMRRASRNNVGASGMKEKDPSETSGRFQFEGNRLVGTTGMISGASQMTITFGSNFQSCTADVVFGTERGRPFRWKTLNGSEFEAVTKPTAMGIGCSVTEGNGLI